MFVAVMLAVAAAWWWRSGTATVESAVAIDATKPEIAPAGDQGLAATAPAPVPAADTVASAQTSAASAAVEPQSLQVSLRGVLTTGPKGKAIVAAADGKEYVVSVGSRIGPDAQVQEINDDHLLVMQGTRRLVLRLQAAEPATGEPQTPLPSSVVMASGVAIDVDKLAAEGVESLSAEQKAAAIGANLVIDDSVEATMPGGASAAPLGSTAAHGEPGQRFIKNKQR
jgi:hypothetical protein